MANASATIAEATKRWLEEPWSNVAPGLFLTIRVFYSIHLLSSYVLKFF